MKDFFSKCDQIGSFLWILSYLMNKTLMENFLFYAVGLDSMQCKHRNYTLTDILKI